MEHKNWCPECGGIERHTSICSRPVSFDSLIETKEPIYTLMDKVADAIQEYDKNSDHTKHDPGADCIRCNLEKIIYNTFCGKPYKRAI